MFKPDFIGIGPQKSASKWMLRCLKEHPEISMTAVDETHFFDKHYSRGMSFYKNLFEDSEGSGLKGEYSPSYFNAPEELGVPEKIKEHYPDAKFILCLRNPIDRCYSEYWFNKVGGLGTMMGFNTFEEAFDATPSFIESNLYAKHLRRWLNLFNKDQFLFLIYEDIQKDPESFMKNIYSFLGADDSFVASMVQKRENSTGQYVHKHPRLAKLANAFISHTKKIPGIKAVIPKSLRYTIHRWLWRRVGRSTQKNIFKKPPMSEDVRGRLRRIFQDDAQELRSILGAQISQWDI